MRRSISSRRKRWLHLGTDSESGNPVDLSLDRLETHLHIIGPPGSGKTRLLFSLFQQLAHVPDATLILLNVKGDLGTMARDWSIGHGYAGRLVWFDPADNERVVGYNPLQPNGLPVATHAKNVREAIRASWGQRSFDETAQLARFLYLTLFVVREMNFTLTEALGLLRPESLTRKAMLPAIADPYIRDEFVYLDSLRGARQDELVASTLARLESFVLDPAIRRIITQQAHSLDLGQLIRDKQILILNFEQNKPLALDDVKLLGRFIINDIVNQVFRRPKNQRAPVYLFLDECQTVATADLCRALDQGRELGLHCILANQFLQQLNLEEASGLLYHSVMECARTKVLFGGISTKELEMLTPEVMVDRYDPWRVKDEITTLECEPIESTRTVLTEGGSTTEEHGESRGTSHSTSHAQTRGQEISRGQTVGSSEGRGTSRSQGLTRSLSQGTSYTRGHSASQGMASSYGRGSSSSAQESFGQTSSPNQTGILSGPGLLQQSEQHSTGNADSDFRSHTQSAAESVSDADTESLTTGEAFTTGVSVQRSFGQNRSLSTSQGESVSNTQGEQDGISRTESRGVSQGRTWTRSVTPFYEYRKRRTVSSRQFLGKEEQLTMALQQLQSQPLGHFFIKTLNHAGIFVRAPFVKIPWISGRLLTAGLGRVYQQSKYASPQEIRAEEDERSHRLRELEYNYNNEEATGVSPTTEVAKPPQKQSSLPNPKKKGTASRKKSPAQSNLFDTIKTEDE
jgi:hypothetical protein